MKWNKPAENVMMIAALAGATREELQEWLPSRQEIPENFFSWNNPWNNFASTMFFKGGMPPATKQGIDPTCALGHIKAVLLSMEPEHNHKIAGCAWLASLWYTKPVILPVPPEKQKAQTTPFDLNSKNQQKKRARQKRKHRKK